MIGEGSGVTMGVDKPSGRSERWEQRMSSRSGDLARGRSSRVCSDGDGDAVGTFNIWMLAVSAFDSEEDGKAASQDERLSCRSAMLKVVCM